MATPSSPFSVWSAPSGTALLSAAAAAAAAAGHSFAFEPTLGDSSCAFPSSPFSFPAGLTSASFPTPPKLQLLGLDRKPLRVPVPTPCSPNSLAPPTDDADAVTRRLSIAGYSSAFRHRYPQTFNTVYPDSTNVLALRLFPLPILSYYRHLCADTEAGLLLCCSAASADAPGNGPHGSHLARLLRDPSAADLAIAAALRSGALTLSLSPLDAALCHLPLGYLCLQVVLRSYYPQPQPLLNTLYTSAETLTLCRPGRPDELTLDALADLSAQLAVFEAHGIPFYAPRVLEALAHAVEDLLPSSTHISSGNGTVGAYAARLCDSFDDLRHNASAADVRAIVDDLQTFALAVAQRSARFPHKSTPASATAQSADVPAPASAASTHSQAHRYAAQLPAHAPFGQAALAATTVTLATLRSGLMHDGGDPIPAPLPLSPPLGATQPASSLPWHRKLAHPQRGTALSLRSRMHCPASPPAASDPANPPNKPSPPSPILTPRFPPQNRAARMPRSRPFSLAIVGPNFPTSPAANVNPNASTAAPAIVYPKTPIPAPATAGPDSLATNNPDATPPAPDTSRTSALLPAAASDDPDTPPPSPDTSRPSAVLPAAASDDPDSLPPDRKSVG